MICRLCLKHNKNIIDIFGEIGTSEEMANTLGKHFWFQPQQDDPISTAICENCWSTVSNFNNFYLKVQRAHLLLTERFSIKNSENKIKKCEISNTNHLTSKVNQKMDSVEFFNNNAAIEMVFEIDDELEALEANANGVQNLEKSFQEEYVDSLDVYSLEESIHIETPKEEIKILQKSERRFTRSLAKTIENSMDALNTPEKSIRETKELKNVELIATSPESTMIRKQRGRPRKNNTRIAPTAKQKQIKNLNFIEPKIKVEIDEQNDDSQEIKMDENDLKIAEHMHLSCDICALKLLTFTTLRKHMKNAHGSAAYAICCGKKFYKRSLLLEHIAKHINPEQYKCNECCKIFNSKQCMRNHFLLKHQPEEAKTFQCDDCPKKFAKSYLLTLHRNVHLAKKEHTFICKVCQKSFATAQRLTSHVKLLHSDYATMCDICAKLIRGRSAFVKHQLQHSGVVIPKVQCDTCGSWHKDKYSLQKHKRRHNEDGTVHLCNICNKVAPNRSALLSHQRYVHASERKYICGVCQKAFKKPLSLKEHMALHTGATLYTCAHCSKTFNSNANMHSHRKKVHPKEFEEARKNRLEASKLSVPVTTKPTTLENEETISQLITIHTDDDGETHNILVTTGDFSEDDIATDGHSIILTVNPNCT